MRVKFHLCTGGFCCHPEWSCMAGGRFKSVEFPAHFGLIDHPEQGVILFDTGYAQHIKPATERWPYRAYSLLLPFQIPPDQEIDAQLGRYGYSRADVKWIFISHFHPDHIAGLQDFPQARFICSRVAWNALHQRRGWGALKHAFLPDLLPPDFATRVRWIEDAPSYSLQGRLPGFSFGQDLFGDTSLLAIPLPGHAIGQYGLYLQETHTGRPIFLIADACWRSTSYRHYRLPPALTLSLLHDAQAYKTTLLALHRLSLTRDDIMLIPSHCDEIAARLP